VSVKLLIASGSEAVVSATLEKFKTIFPELPLVVVSEFKPADTGCEWIPYHIRRSWADNRALIRSRLRGRKIRIAAIILEPRTPHRRMRLLGASLSPLRLIAFNETGQHIRVRPDNLAVYRNLWWRAGNLLRSQMRPGGWLHNSAAALAHPESRQLRWLYLQARLRRGRPAAAPGPMPACELPPGISVVIPSRNGRDLLAACLPRIEGANEIIVVDNGSDDGTAAWLRLQHPQVLIETNLAPLSFAEAANRGLHRARFSHVCLLNNDMLAEPGFLAALRRAFDRNPDLFSATAQIFLPEGRRREETGKTILLPEIAATDFPVRYAEPVGGEDGAWVLYGSGGCTLYDTAKLRQLGGFDPQCETAYVEDLDVGVRAWRRGWPSVYCASARVLHRHRATTSRYFDPQELDRILERNFLRFLAREMPDLWLPNLRRLLQQRKADALKLAAQIGRGPGRKPLPRLFSGRVAVFPGRSSSERPRVLIASPYLPFPLSHGAAVRMYNLMRRCAAEFDQILVCFVDQLATIPPELAEICSEIITVQRPGTHALPSTRRPDTVEEFDSPEFHSVLQRTVAKWQPQIAQLEFTQMAQYAADCRPAHTVLVEHDITYDLYSQILKQSKQEDWEIRRQYERWLGFERNAWKTADRVVVMSARDQAEVQQEVPGAVAIPNGVDLDRFRPSGRAPENRRLLFIGSFAHRPNVLAMEFFLREVFPRLRETTLHVIAGQRHEAFWNLKHPGVEVEGFVWDVRPAYERATVVIAPLVASAGTNIKIMEAMAMGKAIVSTEAGIHGLELDRGADVIVADQPDEITAAITRLLDCPLEREKLERHARRTAELRYGWDAIAAAQRRLYRELL